MPSLIAIATPPPSLDAAACASARAFGHDGGGARDRVGQIEVRRPASRTASLPSLPPLRRELLDVAARRRQRSGRCAPDADAPRTCLARSCGERVEGQRLAEHVGQRAQDRPVLARLARREGGAAGHLHAALGVDVGRRTSRCRRRPAGSRRRGARRRRRGVPMIDDEGLAEPRHVDLVGAEQEQHVERARLSAICGDVEPALARHEAEIEPADARGRRVQHAEAVPAVRDRADVRRRRFAASASNRRAVGPRQRALRRR